MPRPRRPVLSRRGFLAGSAAGGALLLVHPFTARAQANQAHLRLMETTDLHVHVYPYDYYADRPIDTVGLSRIAAIVRDIRAEAANSLLLDNGDFLQGNPMGDYIAYERGMAEGDMHPVIAAMNAVGVEASTLGNHEFNYGLDFLAKSLAGADFPVVCANIASRAGATPRDDTTLLPPYVVLDRMLTDGAGNVSLTETPPQEESTKIADMIRRAGIHSVVINMEHQAYDRGLADSLARSLGGPCYCLADLRAAELYRTVREELEEKS